MQIQQVPVSSRRCVCDVSGSRAAIVVTPRATKDELAAFLGVVRCGRQECPGAVRSELGAVLLRTLSVCSKKRHFGSWRATGGGQGNQWHIRDCKEIPVKRSLSFRGRLIETTAVYVRVYALGCAHVPLLLSPPENVKRILLRTHIQREIERARIEVGASLHHTLFVPLSYNRKLFLRCSWPFVPREFRVENFDDGPTDAIFRTNSSVITCTPSHRVPLCRALL